MAWYSGLAGWDRDRLPYSIQLSGLVGLACVHTCKAIRRVRYLAGGDLGGICFGQPVAAAAKLTLNFRVSVGPSVGG